jgi:hypothetical protein
MTIIPTLPLDYVQRWRPTLEGLSDDDILQWYHAVIPQLRPDAALVEIGVWRGRSLLFAAELLAALGRTSSRILGVDPYRYPPVDGDPECCTVSYLEAVTGLLAHASDLEMAHLHVLPVRSTEAARIFKPASVDLVMLDGDHSFAAVVRDIIDWRPRIRPGGVLGGHDYAPDRPGVMRAVDRLVGPGVQLHGTVWWTIVGR